MGLLAESLRSWLSSDKALARWLGGGQTVAAGLDVNVDAAMKYPAFSSAVTLIQNEMALAPLYRRMGEGRARAREHPLDRLLSASPNGEQSAFTWRREMMFAVLTAGAGYAEIQRDNSGRPVALWPIDPERVTPGRDPAGRPVYSVYNPPRSGQLSNLSNWRPEVTLSEDQILVILGPGSRDGLTPSSPVARAREAIGLGLGTEKFGATFFGNGAWPGLIAQHPGKLSEAAHTRLKESLNNALKGPSRAHSLILTEEGIKIEKAGIPPEDSQFLQTRQHQINEIARLFNLPPTLIGGSLENGLTYANSLSEAQRFVDQCLLPWAVLWEQELNRKLLTTLERDSMYFEMVFESLLRGDVPTRYAAYRTALESGFLTVSEVRARENLPALPEAPPSAPTNGNRPRSRPDGADHVVVSEALARVLRRWGAEFIRAASAADVRQRLAKFAGADDADGHTRQILETAFALVPGASAWAVARALRAECVSDVQHVLDTTSAEHVPNRVLQHIEKQWPIRAGSLAAELIRNGGTHG
jgi:HK97 family phage portal protein